MKMHMGKYRVVPFPQERRLITDVGWMAQNKPTIYGLLEIDVTTPRQLIRDHKEKTGERLSFTAYLVVCWLNNARNSLPGLAEHGSVGHLPKMGDEPCVVASQRNFS